MEEASWVENIAKGSRFVGGGVTAWGIWRSGNMARGYMEEGQADRTQTGGRTLEGDGRSSPSDQRAWPAKSKRNAHEVADRHLGWLRALKDHATLGAQCQCREEFARLQLSDGVRLQLPELSGLDGSIRRRRRGKRRRRTGCEGSGRESLRWRSSPLFVGMSKRKGMQLEWRE